MSSGALKIMMLLFCLVSKQEALQCLCNSPRCVNGLCTAPDKGYCFKRLLVSDGTLVYGCFQSTDVYLCNTSSTVHNTLCCTAHDACNRDEQLAPEPSTTSNDLLLTCAQKSATDVGARTCTIHTGGFCYFSITTVASETRYEQGCSEECDQGLTENAQKLCCTTDRCNNVTMSEKGIYNTLYSCYCTGQSCNGVCVSTVGCYVDNETNAQGCISSREPCPASNRACCYKQWCNVRASTTNSTGIEQPSATINVNSTSHYNRAHSAANNDVTKHSDTRLEITAVLITMVMIALVAAISCSLIAAYIRVKHKAKERQKPEPYLTQLFIETSV